MNDLWEAGIVVACMLGVFSVGVWVGDEQITYNVEDGELSYQYVNFTGEIERGLYDIKFQENIEKPEKYKNTSTVVYGEASRDGRNLIIKMRTGRSAGELVETCRHEILHQYFPNYRHPNFLNPAISRSDDPIYRLEDKVDFEVCEDVVATALKKQR